MEIVKSTPSENIIKTKDLDVVILQHENYEDDKRDLEENKCDKMVANTQDNLNSSDSTEVNTISVNEQHKDESSVNEIVDKIVINTDVEEENVEHSAIDLIEQEEEIVSAELKKIDNDEIASPQYESTKDINDTELETKTNEILIKKESITNIDLQSEEKKFSTLIENIENDDLLSPKSIKDSVGDDDEILLTEDEDPNDDDNDTDDEEQELNIKNIERSSDGDYDIEDDTNNSVMILDSSDEEKEREAVEKSQKQQSKIITAGTSAANISLDFDDDFDEDSSDVDSDDYDDNDLMNDIVLSAAQSKLHNLPSTSKNINGRKLTKLLRQKKKLKRAFSQFNFRCMAKNRSIKRLNLNRIMHNVEERHHHNNHHNHNIKIPKLNIDSESMTIGEIVYDCSTSSLANSVVDINLHTTIKSNEISTYSEEEIIDLDDTSPQKYDLEQTKILKNLPKIDCNIDEKNGSIKNDLVVEKSDVGKILNDLDEIEINIDEEIVTKMQPVEKIRETIQKSDDLKELPLKINIIDEQNKENLVNNEKNKIIAINCNDSVSNNNNNNNNEEIIVETAAVCNGDKIENDVDDDKILMEIDENGEKKIDISISLSETMVATSTNDSIKVSKINQTEPNDKNLIENIKIEKEIPIEINEIKENDNSLDIENIKKSNELIIDDNDLKKESATIPTTSAQATATAITLSNPLKRLRSINLEDSQLNASSTITTSTPTKSPTTASSITASIILPQQKSLSSDNDNDNDDDDDETEETLHPTKKLRAELETNFQTHDRILSEYIERTSNDSPNDIDKHIGQLAIEIQTLNDMIKAKEIEWNNMLHLKKVKEEICFRLTRKKQVMEMMSIKIGEISLQNPQQQQQQQQQQLNHEIFTSNLFNTKDLINSPKIINDLHNQSTLLKIPNISTTSSALAAMAAAATSINSFNLSGNSSNSNNGNGNLSTTQSILQNRASMKSSDLAKEKANTQKLHRNILPKPSNLSASSSSTPNVALTTSSLNAQLGNIFGTSASSGLNSQQQQQHQQQQQFPLSLSNIAGGSLLNHLNNNSNNGLIHQQQPILNSYLTAAASVQQQLGELFNGHHQHQSQQQQQQNAQNLMVGRQGVFKDVKSIIADYRQRHPEQVPRRGRRMKSINSNDITSCGQRGNNSDLNSLLNRFEGNSRPSSNDSSSHSMTNPTGGNGNLNSSNSNANVSFKDALLQIAKISGQNANRLTSAVTPLTGKTSNIGNNVSSQQNLIGTPYPEVTLHPVSTTNLKNDSTGSLLHGILTKYTRANNSSPSATVVASGGNNSTTSSMIAHQLSQQHTTCTPTSTTNNYSTHSPTLARLLTAPERIANAAIQNNNNNNNNILNNHGSHSTMSACGGSGNINATTNSYQNSSTNVSCGGSSGGVGGGGSGGLNLSKVVGHNSEITITPVINSALNLHQTLLQQQIQNQQQFKEALSRNAGINERLKGENIMNLDDEADDSVDRLVIDEGGDSSIGGEEQYRVAPRAIGQEFNENEVPACQGCKKQEAQFVCAGCGNQWYCSRECQVQAWDEHSEVCTG